jgi:integrase
MRRVTKPKEPRGRVRFLSDDERAHLLDACRSSRCPYLYAVVVLALSTGMRHGEIMNLRWSDVDLLKGRIILHDTKNGERRNVPLTGHAHHEMEKLSKVRRIDTALVFPNTNFGEKARPYEIRKSWNTALKKAEIEDFRFHDLRHSTASYLAMNGATLSEIAEVLGHKTLQMVKRYAHLSEAHTASVVRAMNDRLFRESGKGPTAAAS